MTKVYFVRHAQPEHDWEEDRTRPLTEEGKKDSEIVLEFLKDKKIDAFYCSPYKRSMDTIAEAAAFFTKEIITDERLREREKGSDGNNHGMFQKRWADHDYHEEGGESIAMVQKLACLRQELSQLVTEQEYFNQYVKESDVHTDSIKFKKKLSSKQWMVLWQECQLISEEKTAIGFWFKIKALLKYGVTDWGTYKQNISKILTTFPSIHFGCYAKCNTNIVTGTLQVSP